MAIWGAKVLLGYVPLVGCIYYLIRTREDLEKLLRLQAMLVLVACSLGLIQYGMLKTGICPGTIGEGEDSISGFIAGSLFCRWVSAIRTFYGTDSSTGNIRCALAVGLVLDSRNVF